MGCCNMFGDNCNWIVVIAAIVIIWITVCDGGCDCGCRQDRSGCGCCD